MRYEDFRLAEYLLAFEPGSSLSKDLNLPCPGTFDQTRPLIVVDRDWTVLLLSVPNLVSPDEVVRILFAVLSSGTGTTDKRCFG